LASLHYGAYGIENNTLLKYLPRIHRYNFHRIDYGKRPSRKILFVEI